LSPLCDQFVPSDFFSLNCIVFLLSCHLGDTLLLPSVDNAKGGLYCKSFICVMEILNGSVKDRSVGVSFVTSLKLKVFSYLYSFIN